jgi:hypothetical protein
MLAPWVVEEMKSLQLPDKRLDARLREVLSQLGEHPTASIPAASGGHAEMAAAYRLFDNERVTFDDILRPHGDATRKRIAAQPVALLVQDTTDLDLTRPQQQVVGAGPLDSEARRGALLHLMHAFAPDGMPLGTMHATTWTRESAPAASRKDDRYVPIEEKESHRWVAALRQAREEAARCESTRLVCLADSEADIYEVFLEGMAEPRSIDWIVRAGQNRSLQSAGTNADSPADLLREQVLKSDVLFSKSITIRRRQAKISCEDRARRQSRESRVAEVDVRAERVMLQAPWRPGHRLPDLKVNVVLVREIDPPANEPAVEWLLLTSLPIDSVEEVRQVIQYYSVRWMVEVLFRTLKSGCRVEERRFEQLDRLLTCLAVYLVVAWRVLYVCRLGQGSPDLSCEAVFEPAEWKAVYRVVRREPPPCQPPKLGEILKLVASLGGYVLRKRKDPPGPQTVWLGLQRMHDMALCWQLFGPEARNDLQLV